MMKDSKSKDLVFWLHFIESNTEFEVNFEDSKLIQDAFNTVYLIQTLHEKLILRISDIDKVVPLTKDDYTFEIEMLLHLKNKDFKVAYPIKWKNNSFIKESEFNGKKVYCVLFSYAEGRPLPEDNEQYHFDFGRNIANLHTIMATAQFSGKRLKWDNDFAINSAVLDFEKYLGQKRKKDLEDLLEIQSFLINRLNRYEDKIPKGSVHGDVHNFNVHFTEDGSFTMFDFDFMGESFLAFDLATFISTEKFFFRINEVNLTNSQLQFIKGYNSIRPISKEEIEIMPLLEIKRWLILFGAWAKSIAQRGEDKWGEKTVESWLLERVDRLLPHFKVLMNKWENQDYYYYNDLLEII